MSGEDMANDDTVGYIVLGFAMSVLFVPWICLLISVRVAAVAAGVLTGTASVLFLIFEFQSEPHVPVELFVIPPLLLLAWLRFFRLWQRALRESSNQIGHDTDSPNRIADNPDRPVPRKVLGEASPIPQTALDIAQFVMLAALVCFLILYAFTFGNLF